MIKHFFAVFESDTFLPIRYSFRSLIFKKSANFAPFARGKVFIFKKSQGPHENLQDLPYTAKNNQQKIKECIPPIADFRLTVNIF